MEKKIEGEYKRGRVIINKDFCGLPSIDLHAELGLNEAVSIMQILWFSGVLARFRPTSGVFGGAFGCFARCDAIGVLLLLE